MVYLLCLLAAPDEKREKERLFQCKFSLSFLLFSLNCRFIQMIHESCHQRPCIKFKVNERVGISSEFFIRIFFALFSRLSFVVALFLCFTLLLFFFFAQFVFLTFFSRAPAYIVTKSKSKIDKRGAVAWPPQFTLWHVCNHIIACKHRLFLSNFPR